MIKIGFLFFFPIFLFGKFSVSLIDIVEYSINENKVRYKIKAKIKRINQISKKSIFLLNKEYLVSNSIFYLKGTFQKNNLNIKFKKAYFLEGNFIMLDIKGRYKSINFFAKKAIFQNNSLILKNCFITKGKKKERKLEYIFNLK